MKISDLVGGGGGLDPRNFNKVEITTSQTYIAPYTGKYFVIIQGGGGSGGGTYEGTSFSTGGNGGCIKSGIVTLAAGEQVTVVIGAGGASALGTFDVAQGNSGGSTSFGAYLQADGGSGGIARASIALITNIGISRGIRSGMPSYREIRPNLQYVEMDEPRISEGIHRSFFGLLEVDSYGGATVGFTTGYETSQRTLRLASGGGAGLGCNGGDGAYKTSSLPVTHGAGSGGIVNVEGNSIARASGKGGDGVVYIFEEIQ